MLLSSSRSGIELFILYFYLGSTLFRTTRWGYGEVDRFNLFIFFKEVFPELIEESFILCSDEN